MSMYEITNHPLLSEEALKLGATALDANARVAEMLLKLTTFAAFDANTSADNYNRATDAVALQVSFQVESGIDAFVLASWQRGGRGKNYRRGSRNMPVVHPMARKIATALRNIALGNT